MRKRPWLRLLVVAVLLFGGCYGYYKLSSTGYSIGLAKRGRVMDSITGKPIAGAWVIAQWMVSGCNIVRCSGPFLDAGVATRTDANGNYSLPAEWRKLATPLNQLPFNSGNYTFGLLVFAPGQELDATKSPPCDKIGSPAPPFLCPETTKSINDGSVGDRLADVWLRSAATSLVERADTFAQWNSVAFKDTQAAPDLGWHDPARNAIGDAQRRELTELACAEKGMVPYTTFYHIYSVVPYGPRWEKFMAVAVGAESIKYGIDTTCKDTIDRCHLVDVEKICEGLRAAFNTDNKGAPP